MKKQTQDERVIDVAVKEIDPKKTTRSTKKTPTRKKKTAVEAPIAETPNPISERVLSEDGSVNITSLTPSKRAYYNEISKVLDERDLTSVTSYGSDLQRAMGSYSSDFLKQSFDSKNGVESAQLISNLLGELHEVNIDDLETPTALKRFLSKIPGVRKFMVSVEQIKAKYNTIEKNIDAIVGKLEASRQIAIRDNNLLQKQFENNCDYVDQLEDLIVAGKIKSSELAERIANMKANADLYEDYEISDTEEYKYSLDKRLNDLCLLRHAFKQSLTQIRIIQRTNIMNANNTETQIAMTIPVWKNQLSLAVALYDQKKALEVSDKVSEATNKILLKNSEMMKAQAIEVAKQSQRSVIDIETLRKTTQDLLATVEGVQRANEEGARKRAEAEVELKRLEQEMNKSAVGIIDSTQHIVAKELKGIEQH